MVWHLQRVESWESVRGLPCECVLIMPCVYEVSLHTREKLHWYKLVLLSLCRVWTRVRRKLGFSTGIQLCVFACFPCLHRNVWRGCFMCNWEGKSVFTLQSFRREFRRMLLCRPSVGGGGSLRVRMIHSDRTQADPRSLPGFEHLLENWEHHQLLRSVWKYKAWILN